MSNTDMLVDMQMGLSAKTTVSPLLFTNWKIATGGEFFFAILFTMCLAFITEAISSVMRNAMVNKDKSRSPFYSLFFMLLRTFNFVQMLLVMSYNIWLIVVLAFSQAMFCSIFGKIEDNRFISGLQSN